MKKFKQVMMQWGAPVLALVVPALAAAQISQPPVTAPSNITNINQITGAAGIICTIINWIFWLLIVLTIIFVLIAAFRYLTAAGDPEKVKKAGQTLLYAAIAVIIALIAKGLPLLVSSFIGGGLSGTGC
jgi:heme/copper-type cytochrome/quinol oxidase subunit 2